uniref:Uncharacterized protein n=1 Tax=Panagrolaimus sp. JU765 TaxID=591449 RepID=A0AC34QSV0_9BILA
MRRATFADSNLDIEDVSEPHKKTPVKQPETWGEIFKAWPKTTLCIVSNEFCERFSYYGMRTVLTLYLLNVLKFSDNISTVFFNGFTVLCYLTPLLGSIIADGYIGKFKTIFTVSILYAAGQIVLAFSSIKNSESPIHPWLDLAGLLIIAFGTGGIKPCVASFGGDQFDPSQTRMLSLFFSVFYFSINAGSMISTFISPLLRSRSCLGQDSCYPMAFGIPAILMIVATVVFMLGSFNYKKPPPKDNVFGEVTRLMTRAIRNKGKGEKRGHWLEYYLNTHSCENDPKCQELKRETRNNKACQKVQLVDDVKQLLRVVIMFLPVPIFWSLYDQQGSVWTIQAIQMDCHLWGSTLLLPDQMQTLNAVLILAFIPIFQVIVYPLVSKCITLTPLRKMIAGGVVAAAAFVISGLVQTQVNKTLPDLPSSGNTIITITNGLPVGCTVHATIPQFPNQGPFVIEQNMTLYDNNYKGHKGNVRIPSGNVTFNFAYSCNGTNIDTSSFPTFYSGVAKSEKTYHLAITELGAFMTKIKPDKPTEGTGEFSMSIIMALNDVNYAGNLALCRYDKKWTNTPTPCNPEVPEDFYYYEINYDDGNDNDLVEMLPYTTNSSKNIGKFASVYDFKAVRPGEWGVYYMFNMAKSIGMKSLSRDQVKVKSLNYTIKIGAQGGVYQAVFTGNYDNPVYHANRIVPDNVISILWQVPQIVTITVAEILFSITGYEFAYSQAAPSMKALVQALWLLTTAVGDTIIVIIALIDPFSNGAVQAFVYAGVMLVIIGVFALMSIFYYDYHYYTGEDVDETGEYVDEDAVSLANVKDTFVLGKENKGYSDAGWEERF